MKNVRIVIVSLVFSVLFGWGLWANITGDDAQRELFSDSYWVLPLLCGVAGISAARRWGGLSSIFGKAVTFLSIGLLAQTFGQVVYTYYALVQQVEAPYPSIGDIGFFGAVIAYILGAYYLAKTVNARTLLSTKLLSRLVVIGLPIVMLGVSYTIFLNGYDYSTASLVTTLLDFGYPLGQSIYVAIAVIAFMASKNMLGGIMRKNILLVIGALITQYVADFLFLFSFSRGEYIPGGLTDLVYLLAYLAMGVALISLIDTYSRILEKTKQRTDTIGAQNV